MNAGRDIMLSSNDIRLMAQSRKYQDAINEYKKGNINKASKVSEIIGYCYFQLNDYKAAIPFLKEGLKYIPDDYYTNFFLGLSYSRLNKDHEAINQFLKCLKIETTELDDLMDHFLPLVAEISNFTDRKKIFKEIKEVLIKKFGNIDSYLAKIFFYAQEDQNLSKEILKDSKLYNFFSAKELSDLGNIKYHDLGMPEKLRFIDIYKKKSDIIVDTAHPYVAEIPNAKIVGGSSLVFVDDKILSDCLSDKKYGHFCDANSDPTVLARRDDALLIKDYIVEKKITEGIMLCGYASDAYGHWTAEFLPKLRFYEQHPRFTELTIIIDEGMPASHYTFLKVLTNNQIYILKRGESLQVNNLFLAPTDTFFPTHTKFNHTIPCEYQSSFTIGALKYISRNIQDYYGEPPKKPTDYIYLSRRNNSWRKLANEEEIILELQKIGFNIINIEDYSFDEQVQIFQNAKFIVAPNGSALNSLIFSNPAKVKTIILGQKNVFNWGGWIGSFMELGYEIDYFSGEAIGNGVNGKHLDYFVSSLALINKVKSKLILT